MCTTIVYRLCYWLYGLVQLTNSNSVITAAVRKHHCIAAIVILTCYRTESIFIDLFAIVTSEVFLFELIKW